MHTLSNYLHSFSILSKVVDLTGLNNPQFFPDKAYKM